MTKLLLLPFIKLYVEIIKYRIKLYKYKFYYKTLPKDYSKYVYPVNLDKTWKKSKLTGIGLFHIPSGKPSLRYIEESSWWQSWIGQYYVYTKEKNDFSNDIELVEYLVNTAIQDQNIWLKTFGIQNGSTEFKKNSLKYIDNVEVEGNLEMKIFYGEIKTDVEDYVKNRNTPFIFKLGDIAAEVFNNTKQLDCSLELDNKKSLKNCVTLKGYWGVIKLTQKRYFIAYASARKDKKSPDSKLLLQSILSIGVNAKSTTQTP